ncbi:SDR family oxidoreductase [Planctomicrobium sp. SH664]|uniref:SDR family oxidoreductase n=1 Tax=Planctomicrobium sp. SH664 TaxID=3448125 RepID=UPI003F5B8D11
MIDLKGKTALVTGGGRGIGRACALRLSQLGADVAVNFLSSRDAATETVRQIQAAGGRAIAVRADISDADEVQAAVDAVVEHLGRLDIVVSNAAAGGFRPLLEVSPASWDSILQTNAAPLIWLTKAAATHLQASGNGKVVAISSHGSMRGFANYGAIGASKAALESLVRHFAFELGKTGINFNAVLSGMVETNAVKTMPGSAELLEASRKWMLVKQPRLEAEHVADAVAFLASPLSDLIQGQTLVVDGGACIRI